MKELLDKIDSYLDVLGLKIHNETEIVENEIYGDYIDCDRGSGASVFERRFKIGERESVCYWIQVEDEYGKKLICWSGWSIDEAAKEFVLAMVNCLLEEADHD